MTLEEVLLENFKGLPPNRQQEIIDFTESLKQKEAVKQPRRSMKGTLAHLNIQITEEDIRQARNEM